MPTHANWVPQPKCCWCGKSFEKINLPYDFAYACPTPKCRARQDQYALTVGEDERVVNLPLPKQVELYELIDSYQYSRIYYGGALGGSKSHALRYLAYTVCTKYANFSVLLLRRTIEELKKHHIREVVSERMRLPMNAFSDQKLTFHETNSHLQFGHCQHAESVSIWLSTEYDLILFDELPTFEEDQFLRISTRTGRRERADGWPGMVVAAGNPGGAWIHDLFVRKFRDPAEYPDYDPTRYTFLPSTLDDNPYIRKDYVNMLADLPADLREAWRFGDMERFPGQAYSEFDESKHVGHVEIPKPQQCIWIGAIRWGYGQPGVFLAAAVLPNGRLYIYRQMPFANMIPSKVAKAILDLQPVARPPQTVYGHEEMTNQGKGGESVFQSLLAASLPMLQPFYEPVQMWQRIHDWLQTDIDGQPALLIDPACEQLIRQLRQALKDPDHPDDLKPQPGRDQAVHALAQLIASRPKPAAISGRLPPGEGTAGELFRQAVADARRRSY